MDVYEKFYSEEDDAIDWTKEANGVIRDIVRHVREARVSERLKATVAEAFINLLTLEGTAVCVKLNREGLQIVGDRFDCNEQDCVDNMRYETPYSLLSSVSPAYVDSFGSCLADALSKQLQERLVESESAADGENDLEALEKAD